MPGQQAGSGRSLFFFSSRRRHTRFDCDWSSDVCSSDLREAKHARRRLIEANEHKVASQHDDGNINGIKDADRIGRRRVCGRVVTIDAWETGPAVIARNAWRRHLAAAEAVYRLRLLCSTGSATVGRNWRNASSNAWEGGILKGGR